MRGYVFNKKVGKRIKKARKEKGITQQKLAEMTKMHDTTISRIETGFSNPSILTLNKIAKALRIPPAELF